MPKSSSIKLKDRTYDILDFKFLKEEAIDKIQELSGDVWTDFNIHDPGVTIIEILGYTLTELGYRSRYSVEDILSSATVKQPERIQNPLFEAHEILICAPVTKNDFRKLILDIEEVNNVLFIPSKNNLDFKGIYDIEIELFQDVNTETNRKNITKKVYDLLQKNRSLCEDFDDITFFEYEHLIFDIEVEITDHLSSSRIIRSIYSLLHDYLTPTIVQYSLYDLYNEGMHVDEIFNGPFLENGFIKNEDLDKLYKREYVYVSDLIRLIMSTPGVSHVMKIKIINNESEVYDWVYKLKDNLAPNIDYQNSKITLFSSKRKIENNKINIDNIQKTIWKNKISSGHKRKTFTIKKGTNRNLDSYQSLQNDFPEVYGIGEAGLKPSESNLRKGQAKQLKAYLLLFEQIIANYFAQLENINELYSLNDIKHTYFSQTLFNVPGIEYLYKPFIIKCFENNIDINNNNELKKEWAKFKIQEIETFENDLQNVIESKETFYERRIKILDHILAQFGISYSSYFLHNIDYDEFNKTSIAKKINIIREIPDILKNKGQGFVVNKKDFHNAENIPGLEKSLNILIDINTNSQQYHQQDIPESIIVQNIKSPEDIDNPKSDHYELIFIDAYQDEVQKHLHKYGTDILNFFIEKDKHGIAYNVFLKNENLDTIAFFIDKFTSFDKATEFVTNFIQNLITFDVSSEVVQIIEHILLRPGKDLSVYGFAIYDQEGKILFEIENNLNYERRKNIISEIIKFSKDKENYKKIDLGNNQFKISIQNDKNETLINSYHFFITDNEIAEAIDYFTFSLKSINNNQESDQIKYTTYNNQFYYETDDPYSFIITVLLPDWPNRFQNESFIEHIKNQILQLTPAHIIPRIKMVNMDIMKKSKELYNKIILEKTKENYDQLILKNLSEELLSLIS